MLGKERVEGVGLRRCPGDMIYTRRTIVGAWGVAGGIQVNEFDQDEWAAALKHSGMDTVHVTVYGTCAPRLWWRT
jgi:hypothetical protein